MILYFGLTTNVLIECMTLLEIIRCAGVKLGSFLRVRRPNSSRIHVTMLELRQIY
jgi:hypothetical protein